MEDSRSPVSTGCSVSSPPTYFTRRKFRVPRLSPAINPISITITANFATVVGTAGGISTFATAQTAISKMDSALAIVNSTRADLGAKQNRFSSVIRSNDNTAQNVSASRSRIQDTDYALESAMLARNSVLQQASSSMLAQANQQPQIALSLLQ